MATQLRDGKAADRCQACTRQENLGACGRATRPWCWWGTVVGKKVVMGGHRPGAGWLRHRPHARQPQDLSRRGGHRRLRGVPPHDGEPLFPPGLLLWVSPHRPARLRRAAHHGRWSKLTRMNWTARPQGYDTKRSVTTTYAARTMRWSGVILALFIVYHLLHLTGGVVSFQPGEFVHLSVYHNVVAAFSVWYVALFYIVAMACLCLHLDHGIWSLLHGRSG